MSLFHVAESITCHAWNADKSMLAICPNTNEIWIYTGCQSSDMSGWKRSWVLTDHDMTVSSIDWSNVTNKLVSCSHDRNAFVWTYDSRENLWKPSLVLLRINRAAMKVRWSPDGQKFAVASGAKKVPVCHYEAANDWWISKMIKKHKSTYAKPVLDVSWHPNSQLLATGSADFRCRVFSAYIDVTDPKPDGELFGQIYPFGELLAEFDNSKGWVEAVAWSPSGRRLAFAGHDSSLTVIHFAGPGQPPVAYNIRIRVLPLQSLIFISEDQVIGAGFDYNPALFSYGGGYWQISKFLDRKAVTSGDATRRTSGFSAARSLFEAKVTRGVTAEEALADSAISTKHENTISDIQPHQGHAGTLSEISTTSLEGRLVLWRLADIL